jgi:hypothetical protein
MSNARNLANLLGTGTQITTADIADGAFQANKNLIINGAMQVAQRGTSFTCTNTNFITLDRYQVYEAAGTTYTVTQDSDAPAGFSKSLKIVNSTAVSVTGGQYGAIGYAVEGYDNVSTAMGTSSAKDVTLSFWVKSSLTGTFGVTFRASGGSPANYVSSYTINSANTWEYKTVTYPATSLGTWNSTNGIGSDIVWSLGTGPTYSNTAGYWNTGSNKFALTGETKINGTAGATFQITGVQLEVGSVATPFEHRSYGDELARCQRYYFKSGQQWMSGQSYGTNNSLDGLIMPIYWPTTMRSNPSVTFSGGSDGGSGAALYTAYVQEEGMSVNLRSTNAYTSNWWSGFFVTADSEL